MDCKFTTEMGSIYVTEEVLSMMAGYAAIECYGIVAMSSKRATDGLVELFGRENVTRGVKLRILDDTIDIDLYIIVEYGISIAEVARNIIETVTYKLETLSGVKVGTVNISVQGIRV